LEDGVCWSNLRKLQPEPLKTKPQILPFLTHSWAKYCLSSSISLVVRLVMRILKTKMVVPTMQNGSVDKRIYHRNSPVKETCKQRLPRPMPSVKTSGSLRGQLVRSASPLAACAFWRLEKHPGGKKSYALGGGGVESYLGQTNGSIAIKL
jgi:hypothetical protein